MPSRAGKYRDLGTVEQVDPDAVPDQTNRVDLNDDANWIEYIERPVEVVALSGRELMLASEVQSDVTHRVTLRADPETRAITPKMRVRLGARKLNIARAMPLGSPIREVELLCVEVQ